MKGLWCECKAANTCGAEIRQGKERSWISCFTLEHLCWQLRWRWAKWRGRRQQAPEHKGPTPCSQPFYSSRPHTRKQRKKGQFENVFDEAIWIAFRTDSISVWAICVLNILGDQVRCLHQVKASSQMLGLRVNLAALFTEYHFYLKAWQTAVIQIWVFDRLSSKRNKESLLFQWWKFNVSSENWNFGKLLSSTVNVTVSQYMTV